MSRLDTAEAARSGNLMCEGCVQARGGIAEDLWPKQAAIGVTLGFAMLEKDISTYIDRHYPDIDGDVRQEIITDTTAFFGYSFEEKMRTRFPAFLVNAMDEMQQSVDESIENMRENRRGYTCRAESDHLENLMEEHRLMDGLLIQVSEHIENDEDDE